jgi:hypothetical protein
MKSRMLSVLALLYTLSGTAHGGTFGPTTLAEFEARLEDNRVQVAGNAPVIAEEWGGGSLQQASAFIRYYGVLTSKEPRWMVPYVPESEPAIDRGVVSDEQATGPSNVVTVRGRRATYRVFVNDPAPSGVSGKIVLLRVWDQPYYGFVPDP